MRTKFIIGVMMLFASVALCGCGTKIIDYRHYYSEWELINNSSYDLEIKHDDNHRELIIPKGETSTIPQVESIGQPYTQKEVTKTPFNANPAVILNNGEREVTCPAISDVANYSVTEVKDSPDPDLLYRFTYTFTDADFE